MERLPLEEYDPQGLQALTEVGRPIPGQSLTKNPDEKYPWEGAPEYTNFKEALDYVVSEIIDEEAYVSLVSGIGQGVPISDVVMQILYAGFKSGKWNPDLMVLLIEPLMYVMIAMCEKAGVEYTLYDGEEDEDEDEELSRSDSQFEQMKSMVKTKMPTKQSIDKSAVPQEIIEKVEAVEVSPSLLERTQDEETAVQESASILDRQE
tara:strand:+ start:233 stop:850 length:618 start_codon:yes stop_codon:yes gene_type:complete